MNITQTINVANRKVANLATGLAIALAAVRAQSMRSDNCELGVAEQRILLALSTTPVRMRDVCHVASIDKGQLSRTVTLLEMRGLVDATSDPQGRRLQIQLTSRGKQLRSSVQKRIEAADASIMRSLSMSERKALTSILQKLGALA